MQRIYRESTKHLPKIPSSDVPPNSVPQIVIDGSEPDLDPSTPKTQNVSQTTRSRKNKIKKDGEEDTESSTSSDEREIEVEDEEDEDEDSDFEQVSDEGQVEEKVMEKDDNKKQETDENM